MIIPPHLLADEAAMILRRVEHGFDGEVLPIEAHLGRAIVIDAYDGEDLDEADERISDGLARLSAFVRSEIPF